MDLFYPDTTVMGSQMAWEGIGKHNCTISASTDHGLPLLNPDAALPSRIVRIVRKMSLPSYAHRHCRYVYPTRASLVEASRTVGATTWPCIVHPFSWLALIWQQVMVATWIFLMFMRPYVLVQQAHGHCTSAVLPTAFCTCVLVGNIGMNTITGIATRDKHVELQFHRILVHYARTYFVFDLVDAIPFAVLICEVEVVPPEVMAVHLLQVVRIVTFYHYLKNIFGNVGHMICILVLYAAIVNLLACVVAVTSQLEYVIALQKVTVHFFLGACALDDAKERSIASVAMLLGGTIRVLAVGFVVGRFLLHTATRRRFAASARALDAYMRVRKVAEGTHQRMHAHLRRRFNGAFFDEEALHAHLSEHVRNEIRLHDAGHLVRTLPLFRRLPRALVGAILVQLDEAVFYAGDVLFLGGDDGTSLFFISFGKVACYTATGLELHHFPDGNVVGLLGAYLPTNTWTVVAIETTQVYMWRRADRERLTEEHECLQVEMRAQFEERYALFCALYRQQQLARTAFTSFIGTQLHQRKILE